MSHSLLGTYLRFLRSPNLNNPPIAVSVPQAAKSILRLYSVHLIVLPLLLILIGFVPNAQDSNNLLDILGDSSVWFFAFAAVVMAPVIEELIFRLPLRASWFNLLLPLGIVIPNFLGVPFFAPFLLLLAIVIVSLAIFKGQSAILNQVRRFYGRYSHIIFYAIVLLFGAIHIGNYDSGVWPFLPILVLPQVVVGTLFGFVRLRYGFIWAILLHALHNGCLLLPVFIVQIFGSEKLQANMAEMPDITTLSTSDQIVSGAIGFYTMGGIILCSVVAWTVVKEWKLNKSSTEL